MAEIITFPSGEPAPTVEKPPILIEPSVAPEFFVSELSRIDAFGSVARIIFASLDIPIDDPVSKPVRVVNVKLVIPTDKLAAMHAAIGSMLPTPPAD